MFLIGEKNEEMDKFYREYKLGIRIKLSDFTNEGNE